MVDTALKSTHIPTRLAAIYGSLYLLEANTEPEQTKLLLNSLLEFLTKTMDTLSHK